MKLVGIGSVLPFRKRGGTSWSSYWMTRYSDTLTVVAVSDTQVNLSWVNHGSGFTGHKVYISTDGIVFTLNKTIASVGTSTSITGLTLGTRYYFRIRAYKSTSFSAYSNIASIVTKVESLLADGNTVVYYDSKDLATITKDASNYVARWNDKLASGRDLIQGTDGLKYLWSATGILSDGVDDFMKTAPFTWNQPESIYLVLRNVTWTASEYILDGNTNDLGSVYNGSSTPPTIRANAGTAGLSTKLPINKYRVLQVVFNGANSKIKVNDEPANIWNCGTRNMGGLTLTRYGSSAGAYGHVEFVYVIGRNVVDSDANEKKIRDWLLSDASINDENGHTIAHQVSGTKVDISLVTYDGSGQTVHPSVIDTGEDGWNGYRFWMVDTPYPGGDNQYERPSLFASNDALTWVVPDGVTNPIVNATFRADPSLYFENNTMYMFYRIGGTYAVMMKSSTDSINWTNEVLISEADLVDTKGMVCPIPIKIGSLYYLYYLDDNDPLAGTLKRKSSSSISGPYGNPEDITFENYSVAGWWHFDVKEYNGSYYIMAGEKSGGTILFLGKSADGITFTRDGNTLPTITDERYAGSHTLYKPSLLFVNGRILVFYSSWAQALPFKVSRVEIKLV